MTALPLNRLGRRQGAAMALRVTGGKALPAEILDQILERTDGVPLFLEELTRTMLESGLLTDAGDHYELAGPLPPLAIPANLHNSLMARLDRLAAVKELAQIGAVIGREFSHELIAAVADRPQEQLEIGLDQLVGSELVFRRGSPDATYSFKHALVKDAAYQSLLKSRRQQLHARLAQVFEDRFPAVVETQPELIAYHLTEAGLDERAADAWARAGRAALARSAMREAANSLSRAVGLLRAVLARSATLRARVARRPRRRSHQYARPGLFRSSGGARACGSVVRRARRPQGPLSRALEPLARLQRAR